MAARSRPARFRAPRVPHRPSPVARGVAVGDVEFGVSASRTSIRTAMAPCFPIPRGRRRGTRFAAERGHVELQMRLGRIFLHGASAMRLPEKWEQTARDGEMASATQRRPFSPRRQGLNATRLKPCSGSKRRRNKDRAKARALMGMIFFDGVGVEKDFARARENFMEAAEATSPQPVRPGRDPLSRARPRAESRTGRRLVSEGGRPGPSAGADRDRHRLCVRAKDGKPIPNAPLYYMARAAEAGDPYADFTYGRMRLLGEGAPVDVDRAETYLRRAAKAGHLPAIQALAAFYSQGGLVAARPARSRQLVSGRGGSGGRPVAIHRRPLRRRGHRRRAQFYARRRAGSSKAAEQGHAIAAYNAGVFLSSGGGVQPDLDAAVRWLEFAAGDGRRPGQGEAGGNPYERGFGRAGSRTRR